MSHTINFGIDLGTTNSCIAHYRNGQVEVFRNPINQKDTLPSVVAFRKDRIVVGDKARELLDKDRGNVVGLFKRKMGTSEQYTIESLEKPVTPVELSAHVLRELRGFVNTAETPDAAVITIPASFDTLQSNATKKAGKEAGFEQVVLLQEPIAASLAFANRPGAKLPDQGKWLVYDLGGGTFDVALVSVDEGEMRVLDHEGNNFLGGTDFDALIIEELVLPHLEKNGTFSNLEKELKSASGKYSRLWFRLLGQAEEAKIRLSSAEVAEIEFEIVDDASVEHEVLLEISRKDFENLIESSISQTVQLIKNMLERNEIEADELMFVNLVGGSTFIPLVRRQLSEGLGIPLNYEVDPTTAVAIGAAFYAGTRPGTTAQQSEETALVSTEDQIFKIKMAFPKVSQEDEVYFSAKVEGPVEGHAYRITREDGGFDSGLKTLENRIEEDLPLLENVPNLFHLKITDAQGNPVELNLPVIQVVHGKFSVVGQPLPNDICLEVDDLDAQNTHLEQIFEKNAILPLRKTVVKQVTRTLRKKSDSAITINVVEGPAGSLPAATQPLGFISVRGQDLNRDLIKGSDVEITVEMSESRDLTISAYLVLTDQEFINVFTPSERTVNLPRLYEELEVLLEKVEDEQIFSRQQGNVELEIELTSLEHDVQEALDRFTKIAEDDVTDLRYQLEDMKRKLAARFDEHTRENRVERELLNYYEWKAEAREKVESEGTPQEKTSFEEISANERAVVDSRDPRRISELGDRFWRLWARIRWRNPEHLTSLFMQYQFRRNEYVDANRRDQLFAKGKEAIENEDWDTLRGTINALFELLPPRVQEQFKGGTGIG